MRLIDADRLRAKITAMVTRPHQFMYEIERAPTVKAIPIELYEQVKGERDIAIEQLKALNIELFEKPYLKAIPIEWLKNELIPKAEKLGATEYANNIKFVLEDWEAWKKYR